LVKEMVPTTFKSKSALSTSNDDFSSQALCDLPALFTKMSTFMYLKEKTMTASYKYHTVQFLKLVLHDV